MTDRSDTEVNLHPEDPADLAILNMDIANADARVAERLAEYNGDAVRVFTFEWLSQNSDVLWLQRKLFDNFDNHASSLMRVFDSIDTWTIDPDTIQDWTGKRKMVGSTKMANTDVTMLCCCVTGETGAAWSRWATTG